LVVADVTFLRIEELHWRSAVARRKRLVKLVRAVLGLLLSKGGMKPEAEVLTVKEEKT
jgi:hypothetical protein